MARRRRRPTDWVIGHWSEAGIVVNGFGGVIAGEPTNFLIDLLSAADLAEHLDRMTCIRIVGRYCITANTAATPDPGNPLFRRVTLRIVKGNERDPAAGAITTAVENQRWNPHLTGNADDEFMFHMSHIFQGAGLVVGQVLVGDNADTVMGWGALDVRVGRRLQNEERIILCVTNAIQSAAPTPISVQFFAWIRVLVKVA